LFKVSSDIKERVLSHFDIIDVISEQVDLKKRGGKHWGRCPFHNETEPSFSVDQAKQMFYCFGCKEGGNLIDFVIKTKNLNYREALDELCDKAGIEQPERLQKQNRSEIKLIYEANRTAMNFYAKMLHSGKGTAALDYLKARGIKDSTIDNFIIGYALDEWDALLSHLKKNGISEEIVFKAGLSVERKSGGFYDRFRNRVMFPIIDRNSEVVAFGGRVIDESLPKYINSPETPVFEKRRVLYNFNNARDSIKHDGVVVVEGYMDVVSLANAGFSRAVAVLGTNFSEDHVKLIRRFTNSIKLVFDGDAAGRKAIFKAVEQFLSTDIVPEVVLLPEGMDPDDLARKDIQKWNSLLKDSMSIWDFIFDESFARNDTSKMEGKRAAISEIVPLISRVRDFALRDMLENRLYERTGIARETITRIVKSRGDVKADEAIPVLNDPVEEMFAKLLLLDTDAVKILSVFNLLSEFTNKDISKLAAWILEHGNCMEKRADCPEDIWRIAEKILSCSGIELERKKALNDITARMLLRRYDREIKDLHDMITASEKSEQFKLLARRKKLVEERKNIPNYIMEALEKK